MPDLTKLIAILPCHSLEDFPTHETGENAASLLACWTAIWHPSLISQSDSIPIWISDDFINEDLTNALVVVPKNIATNLPTEITDAEMNHGAILVKNKCSRIEILSDSKIARWIDVEMDPNLVADFFAVGYAFLQVQLMTRQLRYSSTVDVTEFGRRVILAAAECVKRNQSAVKDCLASCFDLLHEERNSYYPTNPTLLDLVLVNSPNEPLRRQLAVTHKINFLFNGRTLSDVGKRFTQDEFPIKKSIEIGHAGIAIGGVEELPTQLVSIESIVNQIKSGIDVAQGLLGKFPRTFGSYKFMLSPQLPNLFKQLGFEFAFHTVFEGGSLPRSTSQTISWQGLDGTNINAFAGLPIDANSPNDFLKLGVTIGEMLDGFHHAELVFAHWPDQYSEFFEDLIRIEQYGPLFGHFQTLGRFSETVYDNGFSDTHVAEDYQFPFLQSFCQNGSEQPISRWQEYWRIHYWLRAMEILISCVSMILPSKLNVVSCLEQLDQFASELDRKTVSSKFEIRELEIQMQAFLGSLPAVTEFLTTESNLEALKDLPIINPTESPRTVHCCGDDPDWTDSVSFKLPPFSVVRPDASVNFVNSSDPPVLTTSKDDGLPMLRNEFFELRIDPVTGGVRSVNRHNKKGNLFSQRLACRLSQSIMEHGFPRQKSRYAEIQVENVYSHADCNRFGEIKTTGKLLDSNNVSNGGNNVCIVDFEQTIKVYRGVNRIDFSVTLSIHEDMVGDPWRNYIASRMAWANEDASIYRSENEVADRVYREKFTSPQFVEINSSDSKVSLLPSGLPFHRRSNRRMLDTLMVVQHEKTRRFKFAIAIDARTSIGAAIDYHSPCFAIDTNGDKFGNHGWIFHLSCKNVIVTHMRPILENSGTCSGVVLRIQETEGRPGELKIFCPNELANALRTDFFGERLAELEFSGNFAICNFLEFQFFQVELSWRT